MCDIGDLSPLLTWFDLLTRDYRYDVTSIACSRLILSLRHHARKQGSASSGTRPDFTIGPANAGSGVVKARSPAALHVDLEEKGAPNRESGFRAHIALDTFDNTYRKGMDNESIGAASVMQASPTATQGILVLTETKTVIDEGDPPGVQADGQVYFR